MTIFLIIWGGQLVSLLGSGMTRFALLIWAWQQTGAATTLALLGFFSYIPYILLSPLAGVVADRADRRLVMVLADLGAALATGGLCLLFVTGHLQCWHLYLAEAFASACEAFQVPAYTATTTLLVPKTQYGRASGLQSLAQNSATVLAPICGGALLGWLGLTGIMVLDLATFFVAVGTLLAVRIPRPPVTAESAGRGGALSELSFGFRYILARPGLTGLLVIFAGINLFAAFTYFGVLPAMILARSHSDELALATVQSALGIGGVVGGVLISVWGGPRRRVYTFLGSAATSFLLGDFLFAVGRSLPTWIAAGFFSAFFIPILLSADRALWQVKVAPEVQGRVFASKSMLQTTTFPLGYLLAGPLADRIFEPAMAAGGPLAARLGWLVGIGPGAGMGLMFICTWILGTMVSLSGFLWPAVRNVEAALPDHPSTTGEG